MTVGFIVLGVICATLMVVLLLRERDHEANMQTLLAMADAERQQLINQIKHPSYFVPPKREVPVEPVEVAEPKDAAAYASIGKVMPLREPDA